MLLEWVLFLSVFFRGFRGHTIHHHKIETVLVLLQHDNYGFSVPVVFCYEAQCAGNGLSPCQALQRGSGTPQERPKG
jgi:hypothetical protein